MSQQAGVLLVCLMTLSPVFKCWHANYNNGNQAFLADDAYRADPF